MVKNFIFGFGFYNSNTVKFISNNKVLNHITFLIHVHKYIDWLVVHRLTADSLRWRHNGHDSVSNHQPHDCLLSRLLGCGSKKTSKLRVTGLCAGNSPGTGEFSAQMASYAENVSIWWRHHVSDKVIPLFSHSTLMTKSWTSSDCWCHYRNKCGRYDFVNITIWIDD